MRPAAAQRGRRTAGPGGTWTGPERAEQGCQRREWKGAFCVLGAGELGDQLNLRFCSKALGRAGQHWAEKQ